MNIIEYKYWFKKKVVSIKTLMNSNIDTIYDTIYNLVVYRMEYANV